MADAAAPPAENVNPGPPRYGAQHFHIPGNPPLPGFGPAQFPQDPNNPAQPAQPPNDPPHIVYHQHPPRHMPSRYDRNAPKFDGHPRSLKRFFEDIETLGRECGLTPRDQITYTLRYLEGKDYDYWMECPTARGDNWNRFKDEIMSIYPGADDEVKFTVTDLELFVEKHAANPMRDRLQFGEYLREFRTRSNWLLARLLISHRERNKLFLSGFHIDFRQQLRTQLRIQDPRHAIDEPWDVEDIEDTARFLLNTNGTGDGFTFADRFPPRTSPFPTAPAAPLVPSQRETFDMSSIERILNSDTFLHRLAGIINPPGRNMPQYVPQQSVSQIPQQQQRTWGCGFCSDTDHMFRRCAKLDDYIRRGLCIRDATNKICTPDGTIITPQLAPGRNMRERIDNWHRNRSPSNAQAQANLFEVSPPETIAHNPPHVVPASSMPYSTSHMSPDEQELVRLEAIGLANMKRQDEIRKRVGNVGKGKSSQEGTKPAAGRSAPHQNIPANVPPLSHANINPPSKPVGTNIPAHSPVPQYRFSAPVEDPLTVQNVIQRSLDGAVTLTQRELLAIAPEVRKHMKEQVTTHRVPIGPSANVSSVENIGAEEEPSSSFVHAPTQPLPKSVIVANPVEELRTIPLELDGKVTVDAILDEGSQVIGIRQDVWEKLGSPLIRDQRIVMESANGSKERTLGLLRDLPVRIGSCVFYLQVQVFEHAPYEMLLGRPFLTLTQAQTHHYTNGDSHITLLDPNTKETIIIPTSVRIRTPVQSSTGF